MNILYVNTNFYEGGAAKVARQLYYGMRERGHNVYFLAGYPSKDDEECIIMNASSVSRFYNLATGILQNNQVITRFSARKRILDILRKYKIDIVHFHNVFENYIGIKDIAHIAKHCRVVWTLHDMWVVTGHCAHSYWCEGWKTGCTHCKENRFYPAFYYNDVRYKYKLKRKYFTGKGITFTMPSYWMKEICRESYLKEESLHVIENGVNTDIYRPLDQKVLRKKYGIAEDKMVLFFVAAVVTNWAKGVRYLLEALEKLEDKKKFVICTAGNGSFDEMLQGFEVRNMGFIREEEIMNELYNLADVYINPSMAESFGCTAVEAALAGTPVIAFTSGGLEEIVTDDIGWPVEPGNSEALFHAIQQAVTDKDLLVQKGQSARKRAQELFSEKRMLDCYEALYKELTI